MALTHVETAGKQAAEPIGRTIQEALGLAWRVSRVRFWLYLGGTYLVGYALGATTLEQFAQPSFLLHLFYFLLPANILLYGINDLFDQDTDRLNPKKGGREHRLQVRETRRLRTLLLAVGAFSLLMVFVQESVLETFLFTAFLLLAVLYSAPPARLKAVPFLDFSSNILYGVPGILAFVQAGGSLPPGLAILAIFLWTSAMQLFSAVPDIASDARAGLRTTAVWLGRRASLVLCVALWFAFAVLVTQVLQVFLPWSYGTFLYGILPLVALHPRVDVVRVYWIFPYLNGLAGFSAFLLAVRPLLPFLP